LALPEKKSSAKGIRKKKMKQQEEKRGRHKKMLGRGGTGKCQTSKSSNKGFRWDWGGRCSLGKKGVTRKAPLPKTTKKDEVPSGGGFPTTIICSGDTPGGKYSNISVKRRQRLVQPRRRGKEGSAQVKKEGILKLPQTSWARRGSRLQPKKGLSRNDRNGTCFRRNKGGKTKKVKRIAKQKAAGSNPRERPRALLSEKDTPYDKQIIKFLERQVTGGAGGRNA